jgi:hypothetical protein
VRGRATALDAETAEKNIKGGDETTQATKLAKKKIKDTKNSF